MADEDEERETDVTPDKQPMDEDIESPEDLPKGGDPVENQAEEDPAEEIPEKDAEGVVEGDIDGGLKDEGRGFEDEDEDESA